MDKGLINGFLFLDLKTAEVVNLTCGVPQGSNLGPLLFLLHINDLPNSLKETQASMLVDDTYLSYQCKSSSEVVNLMINTDLENVHKWLIANKLTLNKEKTECMLVGSRHRLQQFLGNPEIV